MLHLGIAGNQAGAPARHSRSGTATFHLDLPMCTIESSGNAWSPGLSIKVAYFLDAEFSSWSVSCAAGSSPRIGRTPEKVCALLGPAQPRSFSGAASCGCHHKSSA